jgi:hypothetical protein
MATNEEVLEELYELLGLYFGIEIGNGVVKPGKGMVEPQLDRVIFREKLLTRITTLIIAEFTCNSKGE